MHIEIGDRLRVGQRTQDRPADIPRQELSTGKHHHAEQPQGDQGKQQSFRDEASPLQGWVDLEGPTKTAYVYGLESP